MKTMLSSILSQEFQGTIAYGAAIAPLQAYTVGPDICAKVVVVSHIVPSAVERRERTVLPWSTKTTKFVICAFRNLRRSVKRLKPSTDKSDYRILSLNNWFTHLQRASVGVAVEGSLQTSVYIPSVGCWDEILVCSC